MNELIKYFNENYSKDYGKISYPRTTIQIYQVYQIIKSSGIEDEKILALLENVKLPKPKTIEEKEMYAECIYESVNMPVSKKYVDDIKASIVVPTKTSELINDSNFLTEHQSLEALATKENPVFTNSISLGRKADTAIGKNSFAVGNNVQASGFGSHAEGLNTKATGSYAHTEGNGTTADFYAHAEGNGTTASGDNSHAEGEKTTAKSTGSHAEGYGTTASGNYAHAEGNGTTASDIAAHAEGVETKATGRHSHAEGSSCIASGEGSHAEGNGTTASGDYQHVQGKYNIEDTNNKYAHIVGNGSDADTRSNAHTLDWDGNAWYAGKLSQEGTPTDSKDLITKKYFDSNIPKLSDLTDYAKKTDLPKKASDVGADATGTAVSKVNEHNTSASSHSDIRSLITNLTTKLNTLADSDDTTLDQLSEIVVYIKNNKSLIDGITTSKLNISDVADNLTTNITNKALSAKQGVELKKLIDAITVPTKVSQLTNDSKFLTSVPAEYITEDELNTKGYLTKHQDISGKVDKVEGKGLSTVDFTTAYETKLKGLSNYNDTIIKNNIDAINAKINTMFSFNDNGELVVTIGEVSKTFVPKA